MCVLAVAGSVVLISPFAFQRIQFSKKDSDIIAKMKGTYVEGERRRREQDDDHGRKKKKK